MRPVAFGIVAGLLVGCSGADTRELARQRGTWDSVEPAAYEFVFRTGGMAGSADFRITVRKGTVAGFTRSGEVVAPEVTADPPTIDDVFDMVREDKRRADAVEVDYDVTWGFPTSVRVDETESAIDDEHGDGISSLRVLDR